MHKMTANFKRILENIGEGGKSWSNLYCIVFILQSFSSGPVWPTGRSEFEGYWTLLNNFILFSCENSVFNSPQNFSFLTCGGVVYCLHIRSQYKNMLVHFSRTLTYYFIYIYIALLTIVYMFLGFALVFCALKVERFINKIIL